MYLRVTERCNRDGSTVAYYALAENVWNAKATRSEARVVHSFGCADQLDRAALQRLVASIHRVIDADYSADPRQGRHPRDRDRCGLRPRHRAGRPRLVGGARHRQGGVRCLIIIGTEGSASMPWPFTSLQKAATASR